MTLQALVFTVRYGVLAILLTLCGLTIFYLGEQARHAQPEQALCGGGVGGDLPVALRRDSILFALYEQGRKLFTNNCASCHARDMRTYLPGPALGNVAQSWSEYPREDLYAWIRDSQALVQKGHPRAVELWAQWQPVVMNSFPRLTDEEIEAMLTYIAFSSGNYMAAGRAGELLVVE